MSKYRIPTTRSAHATTAGDGGTMGLGGKQSDAKHAYDAHKTWNTRRYSPAKRISQARIT
jgi:hypothetical protein